MAGFELNVKVNDKELKRANRKLGKVLSKPNRLLKQIGQDEINNAEQRIRNTKQSPDGRQWRPWSYDTLRERRRRGTTSTGLLYDSGNLLKSLFYRVRGKKVTISNRANYAEYLQMGTRKMPARPFLGWSDKSEKTIGKRLTEQIRRLWR